VRLFRVGVIVCISAALALGGCSGGGGSAPKLGSTSGSTTSGGSSATLTVRVNLPASGALPLFTKRARQDAAKLRAGTRHAQSITLGSVAFVGTLYPGYAGATPVSTTLVQNTSSLPSSVSLGFNNVPAGNNEWVVVNVVGYDSPNATGSSYDLGQLGGLASVGAPPALASIDTNSTLRLQVELSAMYAGIISTYDLQNTSALDGNIGGFILGNSPSPATGLFTNTQLDTFLNGLYPIFSRTLAISGSTLTTSTASLVYDYRNPVETDFVQNVTSAVAQLEALDEPLASGVGEQIPYVYGNPFDFLNGAATAPHTPPSGQQTAVADAVFAEEFDAPTGAITLQHVYGGNLIVGMSSLASPTSIPPPYYGGFISVAGRAQSNTTNAVVPIGNTTANITFNDPQWAAVGNNDIPYEPVEPSNDIFDYSCLAAQCLNFNELSISGGSPTQVTVAQDTWNPWALTGSSWEMCVGLDCFAVVNGATYTSRSPFYDNGGKLGYYNWHATSGAATAVTQSGTQYAIAYSGGTSGYIGTSVAAWYAPGMVVSVTSTAPAGTIWYLTVSCPDGTFQNSGVEQGGVAKFAMASLSTIEQCSSTQIGFGLPSGSASSGTIDIGPFGYSGALGD
jgi:hypothetical protein